MNPGSLHCDVLVAGGGPAGATAALALARAGRSVLLVERTTHPRFHVGESLLPRNLRLLRELDLVELMEGVPHLPKHGAEFALGDRGDSLRFDFADGLLGHLEAEIFNVERAAFDRMLLDAAADAGAEVRQGVGVRRILRLADDDVAAELEDGSVATARQLVDASGQSTLAEFRELMMAGQGPLGVHRALYSLLAGHVFPRPPFSVRWRQRLMELLTRLQRHVPLAPRQEHPWMYRPPEEESPGPVETPPRRQAEAAR